jgi:hypothetical protein
LFAGRMQTNGSGRVVSIHDGMNKRIENDKDPNRSGLITDTRPHGDHGPSMVIGLQ